MHGVAASGKAGTVMPGRRWSPRDCNGGGPWRPARLVTAHDGADTQPFSSSFTAWWAKK